MLSKKILIVILTSAFLLLFLFLAIANYPFYGQQRIDMKLGQTTPLISQLGPEVRVVSEDDFQRILESPVYFDIRTMPWFNRAQIYVTFKEDNAIFEGVGGQTAPGFNYFLAEPIVRRHLSGDWNKAVFDFNLNDVYQENNFRRFLLSTDNQEGGEVRIKDITVILFR